MSEPQHDHVDVDGVRLHYVTAGSGPALVLLHGFPQTWYSWRGVISALQSDFTIIAPDYRGAGHSSRPAEGYDKITMARDVRALVRHVVGDDPVSLVGHDMGAFVAFAYASVFGDSVRRLALMDAPIPGTSLWDRAMSNPRLWHIGFHGKRDLAEALVSGRERLYLREFFTDRAYLQDRVLEDLDEYVERYSVPGAMRAAFAAYGALPDDREVNRSSLAAGRLAMPVLLLGGDASPNGPLMAEMGAELADDHRAVVIPRCGHWMAEEQPDALVRELREFLGA